MAYSPAMQSKKRSGILLALFFGLWWLFLTTIQRGDQPIQHPIMFFPLPLFMLLGLYWVRWWAIRPPRPLMDEMRIFREEQLG